ncbi:MAG: hypothetical protein PF541_01600 [Prolixibacteraceae bacterium]|jgi:hypothetical protein|nr:hypothetical protein [Prolixibacteraceae bacterium]
MCEYNIIKDKTPIDASNVEKKQFEAIFFFNTIHVHLELEFEVHEYRGHPYFNAPYEFTFIDDLDPDDYLDELKINELNEKFNLGLKS